MEDDTRMNLEDLQEALDEEAKTWEELGMAMNMVQHSNDSVFILKQQNQAMLNMMLSKGLVTEEELNIEFKTLLLNSMRVLREDFESQRREQVGKMVQPGIALPDHRLLGPNGERIKL